MYSEGFTYDPLNDYTLAEEDVYTRAHVYVCMCVNRNKLNTYCFII